jgi:hypothetical protein
MKKKNSSTGLFDDLASPRKPSRGLTPTYEAMVAALTATKGKYAHASRYLECSERTLRSKVAADPKLVELVHELREQELDFAETVLERILRDERHPRNWDACKFLLERRARSRGFGFRIEHEKADSPSANQWIPIHEREFNPEAWDTDEALRFKELMSIPVHQLTSEQFQEIQDLRRRAKVTILNMAVEPVALKPLPAPANHMWVEDTIDRGESDSEGE